MATYEKEGNAAFIVNLRKPGAHEPTSVVLYYDAIDERYYVGKWYA